MKIFKNDMMRKIIKVLCLMVESILETTVIVFLVWFFGFATILAFQTTWGYTANPEGLIKPLIGSVVSIVAFVLFKFGESKLEERLFK